MNAERDRGVQPERTVLAWRRTTLSLGVTGLLVLRAALTGHLQPEWLGALAIIATAAGLVISVRRDAVLASDALPGAPRALSVMAMATAVVGLGAVALLA